MRRHNSCAALSDEDLATLTKLAERELGATTFFVGTMNALSKGVADKVPDWVLGVIEKAILPALLVSSKVASTTHSTERETWLGWLAEIFSGEIFHKVAATASGIVGGSGGLVTAGLEIGSSTTLILRAIQEIARSYGEDPSSPYIMAESLAVLAKGGPSTEDDEVDTSYWTIRAGLKTTLTPKAVEKIILSEKMQKVAATAVIKNLLETHAMKKLTEKFGLTTVAILAEKSVPVIGAAFGAYVNLQFMSYYQEMAHVVYGLRVVEKKYEDDMVASCYQRVLVSVKKRMRTTSAPKPNPKAGEGAKADE
jgi:hypothetical protein